jgi:thymidylate synthase (FAD)
MRVDVIAATAINQKLMEELTGWTTEATSGDALAEFAGRSCYQSWHKPNPDTADNVPYLANILAQGHHSVLEHAVATLYIQGVSRSLTHELIRHRHFSYSELSQRFVNVRDAKIIVPPAIDQDDLEPLEDLALVEAASRTAYDELTDALTLRGLSHKQVREAARAAKLESTETKIVMTGNLRAWRHFIAMRATEHADREICRLAVAVTWRLKPLYPGILQDAHITTGTDGREIVYFGKADEERI